MYLVLLSGGNSLLQVNSFFIVNHNLQLTYPILDLEDEDEVFEAEVQSRKVHRSSAGAASSLSGRGDENTPPVKQQRPRRKVRRLGGN